MSAKQISLKSPGTIAAVVVLLVVVIAVNVRTFGGHGSGRSSAPGYRMQAHPPVPSDVTSLVNREVNSMGKYTNNTLATSVNNLGRDPFFPNRGKSGLKSQTGKIAKPAAKPAAKSATQVRKDLRCSAIMLGGKQDMAIIDGDGHYLGDKMRGMTITGIDADGVTFRNSNGTTTHLAVGIQEKDNLSYRVVTRTSKTGDQGQTHLVDKSKERNPK